MIGSQEPRIRIEPPRSDTEGKGAAMLMEAYGVKLDEWQRSILDSILGIDEHGNYVTASAGISICRQAGKTELLIGLCFYGLMVNAEKILFTSHQVRSYRKVFKRLEKMFTDKRHKEVIAAVKKITYGLGEESIELKNGGIIEFMSRSRQGARGFDGIGLVIYDEAADLTDEMIEAIQPTLSSSSTGTRQIIYAGSPPYTGSPGEVFRRFRNTCITSDGAGNNKNKSWHEWSMTTDDPENFDISDKRIWYENIPSLGIRITEEFVEEESTQMSKIGFMREVLGYWVPQVDTVRTICAIDQNVWNRCESSDPKPEGKTAYGVKFTADGSEVVLAGAVIPDNGQPARITLIASESTGCGLSWLSEWLNARYKQASCVVIDGKNGADVLIDKLSTTWKIKGSVVKATPQNVIAAAGLLINALNENTVTWYTEQEELRNSALTSTRRAISGGWGFGGSASAPIEACSLALWACKTSKRNPQRKMRIG